jgi:hypothetical protein
LKTLPPSLKIEFQCEKVVNDGDIFTSKGFLRGNLDIAIAFAADIDTIARILLGGEIA